ncbi:MAG TPA: heme peroxidase family protein [Thermoleophilaceae bacterium]
MPNDADDGADEGLVEEGVTHHGGAAPRGLMAVPKSRLFEGRFGRMFRNLPIPRPPREALIALGEAMPEERRPRATADNTKIPAAYTYLGQFVDHDITFDPASKLQRLNDPDALINFRTQRYDLDSLYGRGPSDTPFLYEWLNPEFRGVKLLAGRNPQTDPVDGEDLDRQDLPRKEQGRALIGDPRNDENIIVSQLHLAFIKLHDRVVDRVKADKGLTGSDLFEESRRLVTWHYQWVVVHDFLRRIAGDAVVDDVLTNGRDFFTWQDEPFLPVEFSGAAYRFGHSMIRPGYDLNATVTGVPIFSGRQKPGNRDQLGGFRRLPSLWTIDWSHFLKIDGTRPQPSRKINIRLARPLMKLPASVNTARNPLSVLNLRRGKALQLPSGQSVAQLMGKTPLTTAELELSKLRLKAAHRTLLEQDTPLWFYVLKEAEVRSNGERLGPVGARIVAEVLIGVLQGDPNSFLSMEPGWTPEGIPAKTPGEFTLADLLTFATR